tara:strand:- start:78 stop:596 length:519 start_codon:yes stop_codon:yes gene_type:complete
MLIINEVLNKELFQKCRRELDSKLQEKCWSSSRESWQPNLMQGISGSCMIANVSDELGGLIYEEIRTYLPEHERVTCNFHVWQPLSGIAGHDDSHRSFGATIYLNDEWPHNAGGWFVWEDDESKESGIYKALNPKRNMLVLNDNKEPHWVTSVAATPPYPRISIQIWGYEKT